jgi:hypothetical protein
VLALPALLLWHGPPPPEPSRLFTGAAFSCFWFLASVRALARFDPTASSRAPCRRIGAIGVQGTLFPLSHHAFKWRPVMRRSGGDHQFFVANLRA